MRVTVLSIERVNISGTSKKGNPYHIDETRLMVSVPFDNDDGFGIKTIDYVYGNSSNFDKLQSLRGKLPLDMDITLIPSINQYGAPISVISDLTPVKPVSSNA